MGPLTVSDKPWIRSADNERRIAFEKFLVSCPNISATLVSAVRTLVSALKDAITRQQPDEVLVYGEQRFLRG